MDDNVSIKADKGGSSTLQNYIVHLYQTYSNIIRLSFRSRKPQNMTHSVISVQRSPSMPGPLSAGYDSHVVLLRTSSGKAGIWSKWGRGSTVQALKFPPFFDG